MNDIGCPSHQRVLPAAMRYARRLVVLVVGSSVLLIGIVMIVTPGPAFVVIPLGLAILGLEFAWARRLLRRVRAGIENGLRGDSDPKRIAPDGDGSMEKDRAAVDRASPPP